MYLLKPGLLYFGVIKTQMGKNICLNVFLVKSCQNAENDIAAHMLS